jgi:hypothetical protein
VDILYTILSVLEMILLEAFGSEDGSYLDIGSSSGRQLFRGSSSSGSRWLFRGSSSSSRERELSCLESVLWTTTVL